MRKKFLTGVTAVSAAIAICAACGIVSAEAATATLDKSKITVDSYNQKIYVDVSSGSSATMPGGTEGEGETQLDDAEEPGTAGSGSENPTNPATPTDHQILFGVSSANKDKKIKTASWEVHDIKAGDDEIVIDISNLNTQKENYMQIKGDVSRDPITIYIPKTDNKVKMKFNPVTSKVENKNGSTESAGYTYQYRTENGTWDEYGTYANGISLELYQEKGAKLYFRQSAGESLTLDSASVKSVTDLKDADGEALSDAFQVGSLPGKEIKVSVPKRANAPKASVNYVKQTITIPAGSEYRINDDTGLAATWTDATAKTTFSSAGTAIDPKIFDGGSLEVRKKATTTKAASKTYQVAFNAKETLTTTYANDDATVNGQTADSVVKATYKEGTDKKKTKTLEINNASTTDTYEVIVSASEPKVGDKGAKAVKKGKTVTIKNPTDNAFVWIHKVGDNKKAIWSTDYVKMGKVVLPASNSDNEINTVDASGPILNALAGKLLKDDFTINSGDIVVTDSTTGAEVDVCKETVNFTSPETYNISETEKVENISAKLEVEGTAIDTFIKVQNNKVIYFKNSGDEDKTLTVKLTLTATVNGSSVTGFDKVVITLPQRNN